MVPDVKVNDSTLRIKGNLVNLTLCWGEPFNNLDNILFYKVSCSGDRCPPDDDINGITRRFRNLNSNYAYTFSVVAINSVGSGKAGVLNYTTPGNVFVILFVHICTYMYSLKHMLMTMLVCNTAG